MSPADEAAGVDVLYAQVEQAVHSLDGSGRRLDEVVVVADRAERP